MSDDDYWARQEEAQRKEQERDERRRQSDLAEKEIHDLELQRRERERQRNQTVLTRVGGSQWVLGVWLSVELWLRCLWNFRPFSLPVLNLFGPLTPRAP
ncbi:MAG TPA: hypothetical protein VF173_10370 [Thermoanaerobaculia bacterium]|nr:hypothetical protein [Thermoanaerobaculia bacterium]